MSAALAMAFTAFASAHSASDAYLTLDAVKDPSGGGTSTVVEGRWDIALRDLNVALRLDDDGNGNITWRELRSHEPAVTRYAYDHLRAAGDGGACAIEPVRQRVADRVDGGYAALFFRITCPGASKRLALDYRLLFALDPSHRGIVVFRSGARTATALMSPANPRIELAL